LFTASFTKFIVEVPLTVDASVFITVRELPPVFKPSIVTLSALLKLSSAVAVGEAPEIVLFPAGCILRVVHAPPPRW
jgi:hypothetical protein